MAKWTESKQNKDIIAQLTATREDINVLAEKKLNEIKQQAQDLAASLNQEIKKDVLVKLDTENENTLNKLGQIQNGLQESITRLSEEFYSEVNSVENNFIIINQLIAENKTKTEYMLAELSKSLDMKCGIVSSKVEEVIRQKAEEIQDLRESMLELMENAECKAKAENKAIEQYNDCMFKWQAKLIKRLNIAVISCAIVIVGVVAYEIIK